MDTHLILWAAGDPDRLSEEARRLLLDTANELYYSAASLWEITIKQTLGRPDCKVDVHRLWRMLPLSGYRELPVTGEHAIAIETLPLLHKDPFDRLLLAQARVESLTLLTADRQLAGYGAPVRLI
ncbi:type II toxin-antitoxin system VapC family toxin [Methylocaldum szegediense]|uniref:type II toxin-antitoxin system VapC family toxin n=1 Tax=Methylocaldum szegediense TaxID=73780 RepID=UPI001F178938|nr:type II toxin-antitoxin system VapC family toxin [Methylocaldum szegediense]